MARQKKTDRDLQPGKIRLARLKTIDPALDLGGGVSVTTLDAAIEEGEIELDKYNQVLAKGDQQLNIYKAKVKTVNDLSKRALSGVGTRFGEDSDEYEMAGGVRTSERKRPIRKTPENPEEPEEPE